MFLIPLSNAKKSINGSFEFLGVPGPLRNNGPYWIDNILVPILAWGVGDTVTNLNWGSQPEGFYNGVSVLCCGDIPDHPSYLPRSLENARVTARRVRGNLLRENRLARIQSISNFRHILCDHLVNWMNCAQDDLSDEPVEK